MRNAGRKWSLRERFLFVPSILLLGSGVYFALRGDKIDEQTGIVLGLVVFAVGVYLWIQTCFHRDARKNLAAGREATGEL